MSTNKEVTILALLLVVLIAMCSTFWIVQGTLSLMEWYYDMFFIVIRYMFFYTGLAEVGMTKDTVVLCYSGLTKVSPGHVLGIVIRVHFC